ncbi:MAG: hypothetical protein GXP08_02975 [Gammaproteobacteria bacterium]|nr:hypothetical protein [Gammaproteobacteria bacterium]
MHSLLTKSLAIIAVTFTVTSFCFADSRIDKAVEIVTKLCLSGSEYGLSADVNGNISIKDFKPNGAGSLVINVREAKGATALQNHLRLIGDNDVRECTQEHIGRIMDAIFEYTPKYKADEEASNSTISRAKFVGYYPDDIKIVGLADNQLRYYRFTVKEQSKLEILFKEITKKLFVAVATDSDSALLSNDRIYTGRTFPPTLFIPGDYYLKVKTINRKESSPFQITIRKP